MSNKENSMKKILCVSAIMLIVVSGAFADYDYGYSTVGAGYSYVKNVFDGSVDEFDITTHAAGVQNLNVGYMEGSPIGYLTYANIGYNFGEKGVISGLRNTGFFGSVLVGPSFRVNIGAFGLDLGIGVSATMNLYENAIKDSIFTMYMGAGAYVGGVYSFGNNMLLTLGVSGGSCFLSLFDDDAIAINNFKYNIFVNPSISFGFVY